MGKGLAFTTSFGMTNNSCCGIQDSLGDTIGLHELKYYYAGTVRNGTRGIQGVGRWARESYGTQISALHRSFKTKQILLEI